MGRKKKTRQTLVSWQSCALWQASQVEIAGCDSFRCVEYCCHKFFCPFCIPSLFTDFMCHEEFSLTSSEFISIGRWLEFRDEIWEWVNEWKNAVVSYCCHKVMSDLGLKTFIFALWGYISSWEWIRAALVWRGFKGSVNLASCRLTMDANFCLGLILVSVEDVTG